MSKSSRVLIHRRKYPLYVAGLLLYPSKPTSCLADNRAREMERERMSHHLLLLFSGELSSPPFNKQQHMLKEWYSNSYRGAHVVCPCGIQCLCSAEGPSILPGPFSFTLSPSVSPTLLRQFITYPIWCLYNNHWSSSGTKYVHVYIKAGDKEQGQWSSNVMGYQHARLQHFRGEQVQVIDWTWREQFYALLLLLLVLLVVRD